MTQEKAEETTERGQADGGNSSLALVVEWCVVAMMLPRSFFTTSSNNHHRTALASSEQRTNMAYLPLILASSPEPLFLRDFVKATVGPSPGPNGTFS
jgi:hypothetical protein